MRAEAGRGEDGRPGSGGGRAGAPSGPPRKDCTSLRSVCFSGVRQEKPGGEEDELTDINTSKLYWSPAGESPVRQGGQPAGSESCVGYGQPALRSVDSERMGRVIEPRKNKNVMLADAVPVAEGTTAARSAS